MKKSKVLEQRIKSALKDLANSDGAAADMAALFKATSDLPLSNLDYWEHLIRWEISPGFGEFDNPNWKPLQKTGEFLCWLDLISRDGRKRERSLFALSGAAPNAFFFALAVRRLNDWAPQVRDAARSALPEIARATNPQYVADALYVSLLNWNSWGRITKAERNVVLTMLSDEKMAELFRYKLINSTSGPMRTLFSQLACTLILDEKLEEIASAAIQPSVRAKAYRSLLEGRLTWIEGHKWVWVDPYRSIGKFRPVMAERKISVQISLFDLIKRSAEDRSSVVRRIAAEFLIRELENMGNAAHLLAEQFASDKSRAVSERGHFALKKLKEIEEVKASL